MRIAILSCFHPYRGGIAQFNASLLKTLGGTHEVKAFNFSRQYPQFLFPGKTQYVSGDDEAPAVESERILDCANPVTYLRTARRIAAWKPDLVVVRYWMSWFAPSLGFVTRYLRRRGVRTLAITDNIIPHERHFFDTPLTKYFLSGICSCVTLCDDVREDLGAIAPDMPVRTIPHPLYDHFGDPLDRKEALGGLGLDPSRKTLLFFGLIREYKGLDILLEAFATLPQDYQLIIAGEPYGSFDKYERIIRSIGADDRISLNLKYIKDSEVKRYFSGADLCVLPYRSATQSGVSAISFHFEVPMLVTDTGGLRQTIYDTGCGLLCDECSADGVRRGILAYFKDGSNAEGCRRSIRILKEKLSWKSFCTKLLAVLCLIFTCNFAFAQNGDWARRLWRTIDPADSSSESPVESVDTPADSVHASADSVRTRADSLALELFPVGQQKVSMSVVLPFSGENAQTVDNSIDFYRGALLAARRLGQEGTDIDLNALDYALSDSEILKASYSDIVIGPIRSEQLIHTVDILPEGSRVASPLDHKADFLVASDSCFIQGAPSSTAQWEDMVSWELEERKSIPDAGLFGGPVQTVVITSVSDTISYGELKAALNRASVPFRTCTTDASHEIDGWDAAIDLPVCVFLAITSEAALNNALRNLVLLSRDNPQMRVYACGKAHGYKTINTEDVHRLGVRVSCPYYVDYSDSLTLEFIHAYRALFNAEPSQFAFQGYDLSYFLAGSIARHGVYWEQRIAQEEQCDMLQAGFKLRRKANGGFENHSVRRLQYFPDFSVRYFKTGTFEPCPFESDPFRTGSIRSDQGETSHWRQPEDSSSRRSASWLFP